MPSLLLTLSRQLYKTNQSERRISEPIRFGQNKTRSQSVGMGMRLVLERKGAISACEHLGCSFNEIVLKNILPKTHKNHNVTFLII